VIARKTKILLSIFDPVLLWTKLVKELLWWQSRQEEILVALDHFIYGRPRQMLHL